MNTLYNNYVSESAIEEAASFEKMSLNIDRLLLAYESVCRKEELDIREAEIRCMEESGDIDLLESSYMEASEENKEKKEGILTKIWDAIKEFFRKIKDFFTGSKQRKNLEEAAKNGKEADVDKESMTIFQKAKSCCKAFLTNLESLPGKLKEGISEMDAKQKVEATLGIAAIAGTVIFAVKAKDKDGNNLVKVKATELLDFVKNYTDPIFEKIDSTIDKIKDKIKNMTVVNVVAEAIKKAANTIKDWVKSALGVFGLGKKNDENEEDDPYRRDIYSDKSERRGNAGAPASGITKEELKKRDPKKYEQYMNERKPLKQRLDNIAKMLPGDQKKKNQKDALENLYDLNRKYGLNFNESVDFDDYDLPDDFIEESVCDSEINEIAALLDTI